VYFEKKKVEAIILDDGFLLNTVVTLQWDDGFSFLLFFSKRWIFLPFCVEKESLSLGPRGPLAQSFLCGLESIVHSVMLSELFRNSTAGNCTRFYCNASFVFVVV